MTLVDLTQPYRGAIFDSHDVPPVVRTPTRSIEVDRLNVGALSLVTHHVTHLDAPYHLFADGNGTDVLRLEDVCGPAVGLGVRRRGGEGITIADLEHQRQLVQSGDIVFIHTGWSKYFLSNPARYLFHPYLEHEAAEWLRERRVKVLGIDAQTPEMPMPLRQAGFDWPIHRTLLGSGTLICEHMTNLDRIIGRRFRAYLLPLPIVSGDASPVRAIAELDDVGE